MPGYLKFIYLENFKSYKGSQKIGPLKPFTAVIGPNGSGKSNFMDAISFVLGEKASNLRVKKMSELIHGASIGRPVGNKASVTLVYEDTANNRQIRFCRAVQGGSSDYLIDNNPVSKQDYAKELEQLGINVKARNFLVYQGAVESIAMRNSNELTALFEEISHSNDYREKYMDEKARMERSEEQLHHMFVKKKGIAAERKEAVCEINEAKKYQTLREEMSGCQVDLQLFKLYHIQQDIDALQSDLSKRREELDVQVRKKEKAEEEIKSKRQGLSKISKNLSNIDKQIREVELNLNKKRPAYIKAKENAAHIEKKLETARKSLSAAKKSHENHEETIMDLEKELEKINDKITAFEKETGAEEEASHREIVLGESQKLEYHKLKEEATRLSAKYLNDLDSMERKQKADRDRYEHETREQQQISARINFLKSEREENMKRIEKLRDNISMSESSLSELRQKEQEIDELVKFAKDRVNVINRKLEQINNELGDAKVDRHEDDRRRKKAEVVDHLKKLYPGVYDRMLNLCKPIHKRYNMGITRVMGKHMEAIVIDKEETARRCIQYLKDQMMEPETFLPLDYLKVKKLAERLRNIQNPKGVRLIYDVLKYEPPAIENAALFATNNALICETAEDANVVAFDLGDGRRYDAVALDGTFYQRCGFISGGSAELERRARRWDEKELHKLKYDKEKLAEELKEQLKKTRRESDLMVVQSQIRGLETRLRYCRIDIQGAEKRIEEIQKEIAENEKKMNKDNPDMQELKKVMDEREVEINEIKKGMNSVEDKIFDKFCVELGVENIREYEERQNRASQENANRRLQLDNEKNSILSRLSYEKSKDTYDNVKRWEKAVQIEEKNLEDAKLAEKREMKAIEEEMDRVEQLKTEKIQKKTECDKVDDSISEDKRSLSTIQKEISSIQKALMNLECKLESKKADRHTVYLTCKMECIDLPFIKGSLSAVMTAAGSRANGTANGTGDEDMDDDGPSTQRTFESEEDLEPDYSGLRHILRNLDDSDIKKKEAEMQAEINSKKDILRKIQAPNMRAIDKLEDVKDRLKDTDTELNSLREASKKAKQSFESVKRQRMNAFIPCFEAIAARVDRIYKSLTANQSAQAFLVAMNPEEPYLEGINYNCVAPGKRFQPMSNLSGGEKTVAALALLFAIHSYKPSPFFVLDEIDAALDNTNIGKVARFIREKTDADTQCIVISLKEEFYGHADSVVGVTTDPGDCTISHIFVADLSIYQE
ncbi:structural maintenance of chromosomes protein 1A-like [Brevipalpus obovatus]|uniref:structural maintenance of chromosomes protein 1A-like n=1 Tax=Brevipalpus obovatus TaxID=246614 RepID=UPI003D9E1678